VPILNATATDAINGLGKPVKQTHRFLWMLLHARETAPDHGIPPGMCHLKSP
jgi:hypothetical protein